MKTLAALLNAAQAAQADGDRELTMALVKLLIVRRVDLCGGKPDELQKVQDLVDALEASIGKAARILH